MLRIQRLMKLHRLQDSAGENGSDTGGTGTGDNGSGSGSGDGSGTGGDGSGAGGDGAGTGGGDGAGEGGDKGGQKPTDAEAKLLRDVMKHKNRAQTLENELRTIQGKLKDFDGLDPAKLRELLAQQEEAERKQLEARGDYERLRQQMADRHTSEKNDLLQKLSEANANSQALLSQIAELTVGGSFTGSEFIKELTLTPTKARVIYGSHFEFKDGKVIGYDKPQSASERTMLVDATGEPLSFDEAMKKIIEADPDRDSLVKSKTKPGAGSSTAPSKGVIKQAAADQSANLSSVDRIAAGLKALAKQK